MKAKINGEWKDLAVTNSHGYRASKLKLTHKDIHALAQLPPSAIIGYIRQLDGRVARPKVKFVKPKPFHVKATTNGGAHKVCFIGTLAAPRKDVVKVVREMGFGTTVEPSKATIVVRGEEGKVTNRELAAKKAGVLIVSEKDWMDFAAIAADMDDPAGALDAFVMLEKAREQRGPFWIYRTGVALDKAAADHLKGRHVSPTGRFSEPFMGVNPRITFTQLPDPAGKALVDMDFSEIEKRVVSLFGLPDEMVKPKGEPEAEPEEEARGILGPIAKVLERNLAKAIEDILSEEDKKR